MQTGCINSSGCHVGGSSGTLSPLKGTTHFMGYSLEKPKKKKIGKGRSQDLEKQILSFPEGLYLLLHIQLIKITALKIRDVKPCPLDYSLLELPSFSCSKFYILCHFSSFPYLGSC